MVPDNLRAAVLAVTLGSLVALSGVPIGGAVAAQQPSDDGQSTQLSFEDPNPDSDPDSENRNETDSDPASPAGEDVVERFEDRVESLDTLVMTYETNVTIDGNTTMGTERRLWVDYENDRVRTETETNRTHTITVRNESRTVTYDVENERVNRFDTAGNLSDPTPVGDLVTGTDLTYEGRERLDGEETYRLNATPTDANETAGTVDVTVWLDADTYFPTKVTSELSGGDYDYEMTGQFRNVSLNESLDDDRFTVDVPEDAEEPDISVPNVTTYESLSELREETDRSVPSPDVPEPYDFERGHVIDDEDYQSITLRYATDDGENLHVVKRPSTEYDYDESDVYERVEVGNATGYYSEYEYDGNTTSVVALPCEGTTYSVSGDLSRAESIDVAESLGCE
jgi:outer membrane lipoprotein-sorting protein